MSSFSRSRRKRRRGFYSRLRWSDGAYRELGIWKVIDVHEIPGDLGEGDEFDFWITNQQEVYLLRLRRSKHENFSILKSRGIESIVYLIGEFDFESLSGDQIEKVILRFSSKGIPRYTEKELKIFLK